MVESPDMDVEQHGRAPIQPSTRHDIQYVAQMLGELSQIARLRQAEMLCYLIEMAYAEAQDLLADKSPLSPRKAI